MSFSRHIRAISPIAAVVAALTLAAPAQATIFDFSTTGFDDPFEFGTDFFPDPDATVSGFFEFTDSNANMIIESGEVTAFSLMVSLMNDSALNFSLSSANPDPVTVSSVPNSDIGGGIFAGSIVFGNNAFTGPAVELDFIAADGGNLPEIRVSDFLISGSYPHSGPVSVVAREIPMPDVPLPAALPMLAAGLGAFGLVGWRRRARS